MKMPYIQSDVRELVDPKLAPLLDRTQRASPGEMNYVITRLVSAWLGPTPNYGDINAVIGVLECAKQELYRRVAVPYEDRKRDENGDVYP